ncbi:MAG: aminopeptidase, partial [Oscillospiraceae bacterium]
ARAILDSHKVPWQSGLLGKVDEGGGGTVAKYISYLGVDVIDIGAPLLSMHAPYEVASVLDIMALNKAFIALYDEE